MVNSGWMIYSALILVPKNGTALTNQVPKAPSWYWSLCDAQVSHPLPGLAMYLLFTTTFLLFSAASTSVPFWWSNAIQVCCQVTMAPHGWMTCINTILKPGVGAQYLPPASTRSWSFVIAVFYFRSDSIHPIMSFMVQRRRLSLCFWRLWRYLWMDMSTWDPES